jgi:Arc/MetJ-type ribon-helix-helix transcriptional regulator
MSTLATQHSRFSARDAVTALLSPDEMGPLDELTGVLLVVSGAIAEARRRFACDDGKAAPLHAIDDAFSRSIALTREVRERVQARRGRGEYASMSHAARDVVGRLQGLLPDAVRLTLSCPLGPAIVATDRGELQRALIDVLETALRAADEDPTVTEVELALDIREVPSPPRAAARRTIVVELRSSVRIVDEDARLSGALRPLLRLLEASLEVREPLRGGTLLTLRIPAAC